MTTLTFAGSGDAFGSGGRLQACIHLSSNDTGSGVLLDCGTTSLVALKRQRIEPHTIGTVVVSHLHGDHFGGLPFLILDGQFARRELPLTIVGPSGTEQRLYQAMEIMFPGSSQVRRRFSVDVIELRPGDGTSVDELNIGTWPADHASGAPSLTLRLNSSESRIAYTGDTAYTGAIVEAAEGADLLISEAYTWEKTVPYHLAHRDLVEHRHELDCRRVVLTHMSSDMIAHQHETPFETAHDGLILQLGSVEL